MLDYQNCAATLLPLVASAYALRCTGLHMQAMYSAYEARSNSEANDHAGLAEVSRSARRPTPPAPPFQCGKRSRRAAQVPRVAVR